MEAQVKPQKFIGLAYGTVTAWFCILMVQAFSMLIGPNNSGAAGLAEIFFLVILPANVKFGLPIAFIVCVPLGGIAWYIFEALHLTKLKHAVLGGGLVGVFLSVLIFLFNDGITSTGNLAYLTIPILIGALAGFVTHKTGYGKATNHHLDPLEG